MINYSNRSKYNNAKAVLSNRPVRLDDDRGQYFFQLGRALRQMRMYYSEAIDQICDDHRIKLTVDDMTQLEEAYVQYWKTDEDPCANDYRERRYGF